MFFGTVLFLLLASLLFVSSSCRMCIFFLPRGSLFVPFSPFLFQCAYSVLSLSFGSTAVFDLFHFPISYCFLAGFVTCLFSWEPSEFLLSLSLTFQRCWTHTSHTPLQLPILLCNYPQSFAVLHPMGLFRGHIGKACPPACLSCASVSMYVSVLKELGNRLCSTPLF